MPTAKPMLDGRVVLVTGGARGIGRSHCLELAAQGATLVLNDLGVGLRGNSEGDDATRAVVEELQQLGAPVKVNGSSVSDWDAMRDLVASTVEELGRLDAVVNNAGILRDATITSLTEDDWDAVVSVHLKGTFALTKHACDYWRSEHKAGREVAGRIVNTTSGTGLMGNVGQAAYGAAKAGIANLTLTTAMEGSRYGVTANCISPVAATRMTASAGIGGDTPAEGWDPMDPANSSPVVAWLCSEESGWMTGQILRVDGSSVQPVMPWTLRPGHTAAGGERLDAAEIGAGLRASYGLGPEETIAPAGIPGLRDSLAGAR
ncbi:MAG TPA: SDR family NAD(P)-dependent oxidoreductase [Marmoricola sp.]|nr:SDR family NAD(P)-dependent oxidoreductase [Marmoricola sp.]